MYLDAPGVHENGIDDETDARRLDVDIDEFDTNGTVDYSPELPQLPAAGDLHKSAVSDDEWGITNRESASRDVKRLLREAVRDGGIDLVELLNLDDADIDDGELSG